MSRSPNPVSLMIFAISFVLSPGPDHVSSAQESASIPSGDESVRLMRVAEEFEVKLVAEEPLVRQPVAIEFDDRGRLWVIQYLQYPNPNGLNRIAVDRYSRTRYDRVPEPPPFGPRGDDRITILEDADGDGRMDRGRDFVSGLNLASGFAFGYGGVFVLNVPYLLFYPDRDRDDVPDSDPEVLLSGFGMEDAHSVANSLTFGPDGWLYGCQGSTVTALIRGIEFQQGIWRYHPLTREFELFCEGGGNSWGLDFDRHGRLMYSTNYGGHVLLHGIQGAFYVKSFGKHGALHNPHAYGYFEHAQHENFRGGHVTVGGIFYQSDLFPAKYRNRYMAADLLGHGLYWHDVIPDGSTVRTRHGGELMISEDRRFAPTDVTVGPDGAVYFTDWNDARTAHPDPDADWDRTNGRIYRISPRSSHAGTNETAVPDFSAISAGRLIEMHGHSNQWYVRHARQELLRRFNDRDASRDVRGASFEDEKQHVLKALRDRVMPPNEELTVLEALWTLNGLGGFDESLAWTLLNSPHPPVRSWTVRLLGDQRAVSPEMAHQLDKFAEREPDVTVRQQLACSAARLPAEYAMPIINACINRDLDNEDPRLPLLWWWAVEKHSVSGRDEVMKRFVRPSLWKSTLGSRFLLTRLIRRYAAESSEPGDNSVLQLLMSAPNAMERRTLWPHVLSGFNERSGLSDEETRSVARRLWGPLLHEELTQTPDDLTLLRLAVHLGLSEPAEYVRTLAIAQDENPNRQSALLDILASRPDASMIEPSLELVRSADSDQVRTAALRILGQFDLPEIAVALIAIHQKSPEGSIADQIRDVLLMRESSARQWLQAVDAGEISASATTLDQIRRVALLESPDLDALVRKHWGHLTGGTREEKLAEVRRLNNDLRAAPGRMDAGRDVFRKHCAACHQFFGEGKRIGPDLTMSNRQDRDFLLISLVDPSSVIRKEYVSVVVESVSGQIFTGLPVDRTADSLVLADSGGRTQIIDVASIHQVYDSPVSLMPENLYRQMSPDELRDLFAYLQLSLK